MSDEVTSGFTTIEEDNSSSGADAEKHLKIEITDYLGDGSNLRSYLELGAWSPAAAAGTVVGGKLADPVFDTSGAPDPEAAFVRDESGDDMLAPFLYDLFFDDERDRSDGDDSDEANVAIPGVDFSAFGTPPGFESSRDDQLHVTHGGDDPFYLDPSLRAAVTKDMPTFVGWRDHTEGHRITTTRGDKIEVIGGNYKLFVLGRGSGTVATDWSGGHVIESMEAPGLVTSVNWRKVPSGDGQENGWQWVEETVKGNVVERYHGTYKSEHYGDEIIEIIGRADESGPDAATGLEGVGDFDEDVAFLDEEDNAWDGARPTARSKPNVTSKAYVSSMYDAQRADVRIVDVDLSNVIDEYVGCRPKPGTGGSSAELVSRNPADGVGSITETLYARDHATIVRASRVEETFNAESFEGTYGAPDLGDGGRLMQVRELWRGGFFELFGGFHSQVVVGPTTTIGLAVRAEAWLGAELNVNVGVQAEVRGVHFDIALKKSKAGLAEAEAALNDVDAKVTAMKTTMSELDAALSSTELAHFRYIGP